MLAGVFPMTETDVSSPLRQQLEALHQELASSRSVDPESRKLLTALIADINRLVQQEGQPERDSVLGRLDTAAVRFESEHPSLGSGLRQLIDTLGRAGI